MRKPVLIGAALAVLAAAPAFAQPAASPPAAPARTAPAPPPSAPIGAAISLEDAKKVAAAAEAAAAGRRFVPTFAIVDPSGELVYYQKATGAPYTAEAFAMNKAKSAARNRRPTKYDADRLAAGNTSLPYLPEMFPFSGGQPLVKDGKLVGGIGVTGGGFDDEVALAGAAALK